jgi:hypothetical protein
MDLAGEDIDDSEWADAPWWVDAVAEADVVECPEQRLLPIRAGWISGR